MSKEKTKIRLKAEIEKQRMVLSSISDSNIHIECLMEDEDLNYMLSRK